MSHIRPVMAQYSVCWLVKLSIFTFSRRCDIAVFLSFLGVFVVISFCAKKDKSNSFYLSFKHFILARRRSIFNFAKQFSCKETWAILAQKYEQNHKRKRFILDKGTRHGKIYQQTIFLNSEGRIQLESTNKFQRACCSHKIAFICFLSLLTKH